MVVLCWTKALLYNANTVNAYVRSVDGVWSDWQQWSECTKSCDGGTQYRQRTCKVPQFGGADCLGNNSESRLCNLQPCQGKGLVKLS